MLLSIAIPTLIAVYLTFVIVMSICLFTAIIFVDLFAFFALCESSFTDIPVCLQLSTMNELATNTFNECFLTVLLDMHLHVIYLKCIFVTYSPIIIFFFMVGALKDSFINDFS